MPDHITKGGFTNLFPRILRMKIDKYISVQSNICMCLYMCVCACICVSITYLASMQFYLKANRMTTEYFNISGLRRVCLTKTVMREEFKS